MMLEALDRAEAMEARLEESQKNNRTLRDENEQLNRQLRNVTRAAAPQDMAASHDDDNAGSMQMAMQASPGHKCSKCGRPF